MKWIFGAALAALLLTVGATNAYAQEDLSGAWTLGTTYHHSFAKDRNAQSLTFRAMAVDRVPDTVVGRFGELDAGIGVGYDGEILAYSLGLKLGVGLGTDFFVAFFGSGVFMDAYQSIDDNADDISVEPGTAFPLTLGIWLTPVDGFYVYGMAEPAWVILVESREVDEFAPFGFGEEFKLRGGFGFDVDDLHIRVDYTHHQVRDVPWHSFTLGVGPKTIALPDLPGG